MKRARLRKRNLTAQTSTPVLAQPGESLSLLFENMKYRKKPVVIDAVQFNGRNVGEIEVFIGKKLKTRVFSDAAYEAGVAAPLFEIDIETLEGVMTASPNDYIIKGVKGEFYPCKPDVFEQTYEKAE